MLIAERNDSHAVISAPVSHRLVTAAIGPGASRQALPDLQFVDDVAAVARLTGRQIARG
jgi:hypothetical protein